MERMKWMVIGVTALAVSLGSAVLVRADTAQEVFVCQLNEGKTMKDLDKVIADFNTMVVGLKGGDQYQVRLLTPMASDNLASIIWVGEMPDAVSLAVLNDAYQGSEAGKKQDEKFQKVISCKSRSTWRSKKVR